MGLMREAGGAAALPAQATGSAPGWLAQLDASRITRWTLEAQPERPLPRIEHAGSMLHGIFGHALLRLACRCPAGRHAPGCTYQAVFKPRRPVNLPDGFNDIPPTYVITPPGCIEGARPFAFSLTLLGKALEHQEMILRAWKLAGQAGLDPGRVRAEIRLVARQPLPRAMPRTDGMMLELTSPLHLKRRGQPLCAGELEAKDLVIALTRRLRLLDAVHGLLPACARVDGWEPQADGLRLKADATDMRYARYSNRQGQPIPMEGITGTLRLEGPMGDGLRDAFALGQWLHLGGKAPLGQGGYRVRVPSGSGATSAGAMP